MLKARDADGAAELRYAWTTKGWLPHEPVFQAFCMRMSQVCATGQVAVIPYINSRNDCAEYQATSNIVIAPVPTPAPTDDMVIALVSRWINAALQGTESAVAFCANEARDASDPIRELAYGLALLTAGQTMQIELLRTRFPEAIPADEDHLLQRLQSATRAAGCYFRIIGLASKTSPDQLRGMLVQTMIERFCFENWSPDRQLQFCHEEHIRISNGMYPNSMRAEIERTLVELEMKASGLAKQAQHNANAGYENLVFNIYPIAYKPAIDKLRQFGQGIGPPQLFPFRDLSDFEKTVVAQMAAGVFEASALPVLESFMKDNRQVAMNVFRTMAEHSLGDAKLLQMLFSVPYPFDLANITTARLANHIIRMLSLTDVPLLPVQAMTDVGVGMLKSIQENDTIWFKAIDQTTASLVAVDYHWKCSAARQQPKT
jgi:hypothetical protein